MAFYNTFVLRTVKTREGISLVIRLGRPCRRPKSIYHIGAICGKSSVLLLRVLLSLVDNTFITETPRASRAPSRPSQRCPPRCSRPLARRAAHAGPQCRRCSLGSRRSRTCRCAELLRLAPDDLKVELRAIHVIHVLQQSSQVVPGHKHQRLPSARRPRHRKVTRWAM